MQINSLWKLITCQGLGAAVLGNWKNRKCVFWREVIDTRAVKKLPVLAKKLKHRCPASSCIRDWWETRVYRVGKAVGAGGRKAL